MSKIRLFGDTSGYVDISAPAVADNRNIDLPGVLDSKLDLAGGKILQVVAGSTSTQVTTTSSSDSPTGLSVSITPQSVSNSVLLIVQQNGLYKNISNTYIALRLFRDATEICKFASSAAYTQNTADNDVGGAGTAWLDSPSTTSAITYSTKFRSVANSTGVYVQFGNCTSTLVAMEVSA